MSVVVYRWAEVGACDAAYLEPRVRTSVGRRSCFPLNVESCEDPCMERFRMLRRFIQSEAMLRRSDLREFFFVFFLNTR